LLVVLGWVGLGQSADGVGWIGSHKMDPWTTLSQPVGDVNHKPDGMPLLSAKPAVTPATLKIAATNFSAW